MANICIIPARGGSKRIPRKNIKEFCGKPIISYSIKEAIYSKLFDKVIVSTDDNEIEEVARENGASIPFRRPEKLSDDFTPIIPVIRHAIECIENQGSQIEFVCCLFPTAPFVRKDDLKKAFDIFSYNVSDQVVISAAEYTYPIERSFLINKQGRTELLFPEKVNSFSQDLQSVYHDAGQFYFAHSKTWKTISTLIERSIPLILPSWRVQDIDTQEDWKRSELMYKIIQGS